MLLAPLCAAALHLPPGAQLGLAARYGDPGDDNGRFACRAALERRLGRRGFARALGRGIAHRTLPCGTHVELYDLKTGHRAGAVVVDRGPHGQVLPDGSWIARRKLQPGARWRGIADLLPPTAQRLGLPDGLHPVVLRVLP